jgi:hypothetical protein
VNGRGVTAVIAHGGGRDRNRCEVVVCFNVSDVSPEEDCYTHEILATGLIVTTLALSQGATAFAGPKVQTSLVLVDAGVFNFQSQTSAGLVGDGFEKQGSG